jgi:hypothetical protein
MCRWLHRRFEGVQCGGKATLVADMNEPTGAILMATGNNQEVTLKVCHA